MTLSNQTDARKRERRLWRLGTIATIVIGIVVWWNVTYPSGTWRYKETVTVETPEGLKSGSAVREVREFVEPGILGVVTHAVANVKGEAVVVDLGARGVLFAIMRGYWLGEDYEHEIVREVFPVPKEYGIDAQAGVRHRRSLSTGTKTLRPMQYPVLLTFKNFQDVRSVDYVLNVDVSSEHSDTGMGTITEDRFEQVFGAGVHLHSITIEMTDESVTEAVSPLLPPFDHLGELHDSLPYGDPRWITLNDFIER